MIGLELCTDLLQGNQLWQQGITARFLAQVAAGVVSGLHRQPYHSRCGIRKGQHPRFQHLAGCREQRKTLRGINCAQDLLLFDLHHQGGRKLSGDLDRAYVGKFSAQGLFRVGNIDLKQSFSLLCTDLIDDLLLTVHTATGNLNFIQLKKNGVTHHKNDGKAKCRKQNIVEQVFARFSQDSPL